jgi:hypothetical protein
MPAPIRIRACARSFAAIAAALALIACARGGATTPPPSAAAPDAPAQSAPPAAAVRAAPATVQAPAPAPAPAPEPPSILDVRVECWSRIEADRKAPRDLEKRAAYVQKCVEERMGPPAARR